MLHKPARRRRAALYARYSTDLQKDRSIDDQNALCREFAAREGIDVVASYADRAATSASLIGRDGIMQLVADARNGAFDVVVVEALDRISRDQEDLAGVFKRLSFSNVEIVAVHDGVADAMQIGIRGLLGSIFLADLKHKVRRGLQGVVADGRLAGGDCYGYDPVPGKPGERTINAEQADVIRQIFRLYISGTPPRDIAKRLNAEGVPAPRGPRWNASTINGNKARTYGILQNPIYNGKIIWNRVRMVRDPDTGKRVSRANPQEEWKTSEAPHLAIVLPEVFQAAQNRKAFTSKLHPRQNYAPKRIFSGLLKCRYCDGSLVSKGMVDGILRIRCSTCAESGSCPNNRTYRHDRIEGPIAEELFKIMDRPETVSDHLKDYMREAKKRVEAAMKRVGSIEKDLERTTTEQDRLVRLYTDGALPYERVSDRLKELEAERMALEKKLVEASEDVPIIEIYPPAVRRFAKSLDEARQRLENGENIESAELKAAIRDLVAQINIGNEDDARYSADVMGYLEALTGQNSRRGDQLVAGEGLEPPTRGL